MNSVKNNDVSAESQRAKILARLLKSTLTTLQARTEMDIFHPASRILESRAQGHNIITSWETVDTGQHKHRIAKYVLFAGGNQ